MIAIPATATLCWADPVEALRLAGAAAFAEDWGTQRCAAHGGTGRPRCGLLAFERGDGAFSFIGDFSRHYGLFEGCGSALPFDGAMAQSAGCC